MRNASPIAEQELEEMFEKYDGDFVAVCKALVREWDDEIAGIEERRADERAEWERLGLNLKVMERQGKNAKPKRSNKQKSEPEIVEVQVHLATLIEEQEKERRHDALVSALALVDDEDSENEELTEEGEEESEEHFEEEL
jgi:hypothetical protein